MPLKQETLSMNKGYTYALWNAIYMHKLGCEARGCWRGRKDPLSTGVAFTGQLSRTCFYTPGASLHISGFLWTYSLPRNWTDNIWGTRLIGCCAFIFLKILNHLEEWCFILVAHAEDQCKMLIFNCLFDDLSYFLCHCHRWPMRSTLWIMHGDYTTQSSEL